MASVFTELIQAQEAARAETLQRYNEAKAQLQANIAAYSSGGSFLQGVEEQLARGRTKSVAQGTQALVSSGLYNTSARASLGKRYEEEVAEPTRLNAQDIALQRIASARSELAGLIERRNDLGPDLSQVASLFQQYGQGAGASRNTYGASSFKTASSNIPSTYQQQLQQGYAASDAYWEQRRAAQRAAQTTTSSQPLATTYYNWQMSGL